MWLWPLTTLALLDLFQNDRSTVFRSFDPSASAEPGGGGRDRQQCREATAATTQLTAAGPREAAQGLAKPGASHGNQGSRTEGTQGWAQLQGRSYRLTGWTLARSLISCFLRRIFSRCKHLGIMCPWCRCDGSKHEPPSPKQRRPAFPNPAEHCSLHGLGAYY